MYADIESSLFLPLRCRRQNTSGNVGVAEEASSSSSSSSSTLSSCPLRCKASVPCPACFVGVLAPSLACENTARPHRRQIVVLALHHYTSSLIFTQQPLALPLSYMDGSKRLNAL